ncbi:MAG TPA: glycogen debranching N-terminal domain-containing protein [Gaiellaceae bacterium]|nr:glycogen debranching N-terminal domain-containing protein [Gaiellaceae bacterium]
MSLTILEGSTFCVCDPSGDVDGKASASGFFSADTRFLSRAMLRIGGSAPLLLSSSQPAPHVARFVFRNPLSGGLRPNQLSIERERFVGDEMYERIHVENHSHEDVETEVCLELEADFADIFSVKDLDPGFGNPALVTLPAPRTPTWHEQGTTAVFADESFRGQTVVHFSQPGAIDGSIVRFPLSLAHGETWTLDVGVQPVLADDVPLVADEFEPHRLAERRRAEESLAEWNASTPQLRSAWTDLDRTWERSVADLAALRMRVAGYDYGLLPAAGTPWFMTVFGRDTLITCLQTTLFGPDLSRVALRVLSALQSETDDPERDAEPGKIIHEMRRGKAALSWAGRYYGTVDATPLFLVLLSEHYRWTGDRGLVGELEGTARRALGWIDGPGDLDQDGFVEYNRRASRGMRNQSWKDSEFSMAFRDGSLAESPIAPVEVQGYVYDAKLRSAELAREVWNDPALAEKLEREAELLKQRFNEAFWVDGYYALGLDRDKRPIDAVGSNMGHLLWSGIVPDERVEQVASLLMSERLWSGWGVRTMAADEFAYNPLVYHNGTVWPHDNSLIAWGLGNAGRSRDVALMVRRTIEAAVQFDHRLPEVFAGFARRRTGVPVEYPTASRPQAWAAATPVLLLRVLLGIEPNRERGTIESHATELPDWAEGLTLANVRAFGKAWTAHVEDGAVVVDEMRHARV